MQALTPVRRLTTLLSRGKAKEEIRTKAKVALARFVEKATLLDEVKVRASLASHAFQRLLWTVLANGSFEKNS
jgi:hypothetical protein